MPIKIVFFDCDGTLTKEKSSWEYLHRRLDLWTDNADAYQTLFHEGKIDYHEFCQKDALLWRGLSVEKVNEIVSEIPYQQNAIEAVRELRCMGITTVIISSGLSFLVERVKRDLSIDMAFSNVLVSRSGFITGDIHINVEYNRKGYLVSKILSSLHIGREMSSAVGDGDGDIGMFDAVSLPIGFNGEGDLNPHPGCCHVVRNLKEAVKIIKDHK